MHLRNMKNEEIIGKLNDLSKQCFSLDDFVNELQELKKKYIKLQQEDAAKQIWIYQTIVRIHILYIEAFNLLKNKIYYEGWCKLESVEIELSFLKRHFQYDKEIFNLYQIEKNIRNLQVLFPYKLFVSTEILIKEEKCSICNKIVSIRKPCGHIIGEIYGGEMCERIVTKCELIGTSIVTNPENKNAVLSITDDENENTNTNKYYTIDYLFKFISNPYEKWDLKLYRVKDTTLKIEDSSLNKINGLINDNKISKLHYEFVFYKKE